MTMFEIRIKGNTMNEKVQEVINRIRPMLQTDGGDVELVDMENGAVKVRLKGG